MATRESVFQDALQEIQNRIERQRRRGKKINIRWSDIDNLSEMEFIFTILHLPHNYRLQRAKQIENDYIECIHK